MIATKLRADTILAMASKAHKASPRRANLAHPRRDTTQYEQNEAACLDTLLKNASCLLDERYVKTIEPSDMLEDFPESSRTLGWTDKRAQCKAFRGKLEAVKADQDKRAPKGSEKSGLDSVCVLSSLPAHKLDWLLFGQVGQKLSRDKDSLEFIQELRDTVKAHESLHTIGRILHRDISSNFLGVSGEFYDLLVDWGVAKDLDEPERVVRAPITGTGLYMSLSLIERPEHQAWHDLESIFWVWIYFLLRHANGAYVAGTSQSNFQRGKTISKYFEGANLQDITTKKKSLLMQDILIEGCPKTQEYVELTNESLYRLYNVFKELDLVARQLSHLRTFGNGQHYSVKNTGNLDLLIDMQNGVVQERLAKQIFNEKSRAVCSMNQVMVGRKVIAVLDHAALLTPFDNIIARGECTPWLPSKRMTRGDAYNLEVFALPFTHTTSSRASVENLSSQKSPNEPIQPYQVSTRGQKRGHGTTYLEDDLGQGASTSSGRSNKKRKKEGTTEFEGTST